MNEITHPEVAAVMESYPQQIQAKLMLLRRLVLETASETAEISELEETLKWREPSYVTKSGSTIRIAWKKSKPDQYAMYFHCKTKLIETFRELYRDQLKFEGNRAIIFCESEEIPETELKHCIFLALTYQRRKNLPMLGV